MLSEPRPHQPPYSLDREALEREVVVEVRRTGGPGGQHRNVTESAVRLLHVPSGIRVTASASRSQHRNREEAFGRLRERLRRLNQVPKRRVPTKASAGARERRLIHKKRRQMAKRRRARVDEAGREG